MPRAGDGITDVRKQLSFIRRSIQFLVRSFDLILRQGLQRAYPAAWIFSSCPPDPTMRCISPGFYAIVGASAMLGGVTRMTSRCHTGPTNLLLTSSLSSLFGGHCIRAYGSSVSCPPYHDIRHGIQMGRRRFR